jgi:hypothetical protein
MWRYHERMRRPVLRFLFPALAVNLLLHPCVRAAPYNVRFNPVSRERVEARLGKYAGDNGQREATLKKMFGEAGCDDQHLSEQPARGSKVPNVLCSLPGTSDKVIIIGAHFDRAPEGDGVVDNWSGASLLPSLYEALKGEARTHTYLFIGFTDAERGLVGSRDYVKQMHLDDYYQTYRLVAAYAAVLDNSLRPSVSPGTK